MIRLRHLILILFSAFTLFLTLCYLMLIEEKIYKPHIKNLNGMEFIIASALFALIVAVNIFAVKKFWRKRLA